MLRAMGDEARVTYRVASMQDENAVVSLMGELVDELGPEDMADRVKPLLVSDIRIALASEHIRIFLAEFEGKPVGLSRGDVLTQDPIFRLRDDHRCGYIDQMFVQRAFRAHGVGAHLLRMCEEWFRSQGINHCLLHSAPKAVRFYARIGYQPNREMFKCL
jgi:GNAT superfamily N-acetyltransferase